MPLPIRQNSAASREERGHDLYETHPVAVHALMKVERLTQHVWEPAAGRGAIVSVLRDYGHTVLATDLVDYGVPGHYVGVDFLTHRFPAGTPPTIVTNPPFMIAGEFADRAVRIAPKVCLLLRLAFIASVKRQEFFERSRLARVHVFANRLPMMHRDGWTGKKAGSNVDHAWFVFDQSHIGPPIINRITWEPIREDYDTCLSREPTTTKSTRSRPSGSAISSLTEASPQEMLTSVTSETFSQATLMVTSDATSSLGSGSGITPSISPAGRRAEESGRVRARANLSARQAKEAGSLMSGTYGQLGTTSSESAALRKSLASKLMEVTAESGSILYKLTWKLAATPLGRSYYLLRASARPMPVTDIGSWPTPKASDHTGGGQAKRSERGSNLKDTVQLSAWPTPVVNDSTGSPHSYGGPMRQDGSRPITLKLPGVAKLSHWGTPASRDWKDTSSDGTAPTKGLLGRQAWLAAWVSPQASDSNGSGLGQNTASLCQQTRAQVSGIESSSYPAAMKGGGQLNPAHSRWLMGLPPEWDDSAPTGTQSTPKRRKPSSKL